MTNGRPRSSEESLEDHDGLKDNERRAALDVFLKEAEFLRSEALQCIANVRKFALTATFIAGASLPVIASLLTYGYRPAGIGATNPVLAPIGIEATLQQNGIILAAVCIGVSAACAALLLIYVGTFRQIFNFAKYFREVLKPAVNRLILGAEPDPSTADVLPLLHWETWLQDQRKKGFIHAGDSELAAEPILIIVYVILFSALAVFFGYHSEFSENVFGIASVVAGLNIAIVMITSIKFLMILHSSAQPKQ